MTTSDIDFWPPETYAWAAAPAHVCAHSGTHTHTTCTHVQMHKELQIVLCHIFSTRCGRPLAII